MGQKKKYRNIALGIIIDTALKIPPDTGVTYRLYYLSKKLAQNGMNVKIFLCNRNFKDDAEVKNLPQEPFLELHIIPKKIFYNVKKLNNIVKAKSIQSIFYDIKK